VLGVRARAQVGGGRARGRARARARNKRTRPAAQDTGRAGLVESTCPTAQRPALRAFPFGGSRIACRCTVQVALPGTASHGGSVLLGVLSAAGARGHWVPRSRQDLGISTGSSGIVRSPSAANFRTRLHPPSSFPPPSESCDRRPALRTPDDLSTARRPESASRGVPVPSSRRQQATSTIARSSHAPS
jgi:hypothetical protein